MVHLRDLCALQHTEAALGKATWHAAAEHSRGGGVRTTVKDAAASPNMSMSPSRAIRPIAEWLNANALCWRALKHLQRTRHAMNGFGRRVGEICCHHPASTRIWRMDRRTQAGRALEAGGVARDDVACRACPASQTQHGLGCRLS